MKKLLLTAAFVLLTAGCSDHYRYACQDPDHWNDADCKRPRCEVDGNCRDDLTGGVSEKIMSDNNSTVRTPVAAHKSKAVEEVDVEHPAAVLAQRMEVPHEEHVNE